MLDLRYRTILSVAIPLMASSFIQSVVMITDSSFLSRYGIVAFDAAGNGGLIFVTFPLEQKTSVGFGMDQVMS